MSDRRTDPTPAPVGGPKVISVALPQAPAPADDAPYEPVVVAPQPGRPIREGGDEPVTAIPGAASRHASVASPGDDAGSALDWRTGATVGTFVLVLCVVYVIVISLLGSATLVAPALVLALIGAAVVVLSMARARRIP